MNFKSKIFKTLFLVLSTTVFTNCFYLECFGPQNKKGYCYLYLNPCEEVFQKKICSYLPATEKYYVEKKLYDSTWFPGALIAAEFGLRRCLDQYFMKYLCSECGYGKRCRRRIFLRLITPQNKDNNSHRGSYTGCGRSHSPCRRNSISRRRGSSLTREGSIGRRRSSSPNRKGE
uniref:Lipoprotein n=1 Tax=Strongyloides venezuelensis TaxID=75913 RepID=A0A0K0F3L9_STRVS